MSKKETTTAPAVAAVGNADEAQVASTAAADAAAIVGTTDTAAAGLGEGVQISGATAEGETLPPVAVATHVEARVLADCVYGKANDLAEVPAELVEQAVKNGFVDTDPAAVAYARLLRLQPV